MQESRPHIKTYRLNAFMTGALYLLGTVFGVAGTVFGGEVLGSLVNGVPLEGVDTLAIAADTAAQITTGSFLYLLMGISLTAMAVFLYPVLKKDNEELAMGMLLFRGALEGSWYVLGALANLAFAALGMEYVASGGDSAALTSVGKLMYEFQDMLGPVGSILFLIGATCLYVSFYRTRLIPRWLTTWGLIGVVPYFAYAVLHFFHLDTGYGFWLQMVLAPQELVMGAWLVIKGFNLDAVQRLRQAA